MFIPPIKPLLGEEHLCDRSSAPAKDYWMHRRIMTYMAVVAGLYVFPVVVMVHPALLGLAPAFYPFVTLMVVAYKTSSVLDDKWKKEKQA